MSQEKTNGFVQKKHHQIRMERCAAHAIPQNCSPPENFFLPAGLQSKPGTSQGTWASRSHLTPTPAPCGALCALGVPASALSPCAHLLPSGDQRQPLAVQCSLSTCPGQACGLCDPQHTFSWICAAGDASCISMHWPGTINYT